MESEYVAEFGFGGYVQELWTKFSDETKEYLNATNNQEAFEDLVDTLEVIHTLAEGHGYVLDFCDG